MTNQRRSVVPIARRSDVLAWLGRMLLLVPEAALLVALVCAYLALREPPLLGILIALLILGFMIRIAALHLGRAALDQDRRMAASALITVALAFYPWSADALALQGVFALTGGLPKIAEARLRQAIGLLPGQALFHALLSAALLDLGQPSAAAEAARQSLALDHHCAVAYLYLAEAEQALGVAALLVEDRLRAGLVEVATPADEAAIRCALAAHLIAEQRIAEATLTLYGAEALIPRCSPSRQVALRFRLGELLIAQGQVERAHEHFRGVEALDPQGRYAAAAWRSARL
jgi:tetratricopeptide (TPR) repeat protein